MGDKKEETESASKVEQINLGPFRHVIHYRDPKDDWQWKHVESDHYLPMEILDLYRGFHSKDLKYFVNAFAEWGVKLEHFVRKDGVKISYIRQTHRRWTILGDLASIVGYYNRRLRKPSIESQKDMWETFEKTEPPKEREI